MRGAGSLRTRLLYSLALVLVIFLGVMGAVIDRAFRNSTEESVREKLQLHAYGLLAVSDEIDGALLLPEALAEPRFNTLGTGLYAFVLDDARAEVWRSPSALDITPGPDVLAAINGSIAPGTPGFGRVAIESRDTFYFGYEVLWQATAREQRRYTYLIFEDSGPFRAQIAEFRNGLWGGMIGVVVLLLVVQGTIMGWSLRPLRQLARDLRAIEDGDQSELEGEYPVELARVTENLNLLLRSERDQRERYRTTMADLAHSLKTPLAILRGEADRLPTDDAVAASIGEQVTRMNDIVSYQLERAVAGGSILAMREIDLGPPIEKLVAAMRKVYADRNLTIEVAGANCRYAIDERDFMEMLGNLLDNACKYGNRRARVGVARDGDQLCVTVEDDGAGIAPADTARVLARGERLDTRERGQGIGLAVVDEIASRYGGSVTILRSALGGAAITIRLRPPAPS